ncbi:hypothetical protein IFM89_010381 [Coptis chinensis]|uniref:Cation/H+ exchanger domain-containing protein n=1 Tax=Coptis chinensis TaxID=261450 RepID=A0A835M9K7_9MAGN|nr:hypothetical protein IFM89_010381 [Coptis chinensis]
MERVVDYRTRVINFHEAFNAAYIGDRDLEAITCFPPNIIPTNGIWQTDRVFEYALPTFTVQIVVTVCLSHFLHFFLKRLKQPRIISQIICGLLLGPTIMKLNEDVRKKVRPMLFPVRNITVLETMGNVGVLYYLFLVGLKTDLSIIKRTAVKATIIAVLYILFPFYIAYKVTKALGNITNPPSPPGDLISEMQNKERLVSQVLFLGTTFSVTAFPLISKILAEHKLLSTELGKLTISSAIIVDMCSWILLSFTIAIHHTSLFGENMEYKVNGTDIVQNTLSIAISGVIFILFCVFLLRPAVKWIIRRNADDNNIKDSYIWLILTGVMACAFITDVIGLHAVCGAFVFGLIIPKGPLASGLVEKLDEFVCEMLLPFFYVVSGLRTDLHAQKYKSGHWKHLIYIYIVNFTVKLLLVLPLAFYDRLQISEGAALGLLMNSKGLIQMVILNLAMDEQMLDQSAFAVMVLLTVLTTGIISPLVAYICKCSRGFITYRNRTFQRLAKSGVELRVVTCIHMPRQVPALINLLESSRPFSESKMGVFALHLVELTGHASAMLIEHKRTNSTPGVGALIRNKAQSDHIINAFKQYEHNSYGGAVYVQNVTAIAPYSSMHEDICTLAEAKHATFIILPFHKQQTVDGTMEVTNPAYREINQNVLVNAPCSVGILIDRGLAGKDNRISHDIMMLFFGGQDDREALAYARKVAGHQGVSLTVIRFLLGGNVQEARTNDHTALIVYTDIDKEKQRDEDCIRMFRIQTASDDSIKYVERIVNDWMETVEALRSLDSMYDLYIVGRGQNTTSSLTAGLTDRSDCPELGAMGDLLTSSGFGGNASILVVQQYAGAGTHREEGFSTPTGDQTDPVFTTKMSP